MYSLMGHHTGILYLLEHFISILALFVCREIFLYQHYVYYGIIVYFFSLPDFCLLAYYYAYWTPEVHRDQLLIHTCLKGHLYITNHCL